MKSFLQNRFRQQASLGDTRLIAAPKRVYEILNNIGTFTPPYYQRMALLNNSEAYGGKSGDAESDNKETPSQEQTPRKGTSRDEASTESHFLNWIKKEDLLISISQLVTEATNKRVQQGDGWVDWQELYKSITQVVFKEYFGVMPTESLISDCRILNNWLFVGQSQPSQKDACQAKQRLLATLSSTLNGSSIEEAKKTNLKDNSLTRISLIERAALTLSQAGSSEALILEDLIGLLLACYPYIYEQGAHGLTERATDVQLPTYLCRRITRNKIYQAASAGDFTGLAQLVAKLDNRYAGLLLARTATKRFLLKRRWLPDIVINAGDNIALLVSDTLLNGQEQSKSMSDNSDIFVDNFLPYGYEPHLTFGHTLNTSIMAACLMALFSNRRIQHIKNGQLQLKELPANPNCYQFEILGSSPPWAVAEEQAWLLNSCGVKWHTQFNILSLYEFSRLLGKKSFFFYDASKFYVAHDKKYNLLLGSSFSGADEDTLRMGKSFYLFLSQLVSDGPLPANHFAQAEHYNAIFEAYTTIRKNYYTWAYFTAFLDGSYKFVFQALLVFERHPAFRPLTIVGNTLLLLLIGLVALIQKLPLLGSRLNRLFQSTAEDNIVHLRASIAMLDEVLADGRQYLFNDQFTAADIHLCANLVNLVVPDEFQGGGVLPPLDQYPPTYKRFVEEFRQSLTGQYVLRVYREHRT